MTPSPPPIVHHLAQAWAALRWVLRALVLLGGLALALALCRLLGRA